MDRTLATRRGLACAHVPWHDVAVDTPPIESLVLAGTSVAVRWRRNARARRVSLRIDPLSGAAVVTLPPRAGRAQGLKLLTTHAAWIATRIAALPGPVALAPGAIVKLDDMPYPIRQVQDLRRGAWIQGDEILVSGAAETLPRRVMDLLRREARQRLPPLVQDKARQAGVEPSSVVLKDTRSRWGSCAPDRTVMLCWRLVMAPSFVQDYVAGHEVAHLRHMNHGKQFWALTRQLTPHQDAATAWLAANGPGLLRVGL